MKERFLVRCTGGPHPGTRVANTAGGFEMEWPLPELV